MRTFDAIIVGSGQGGTPLAIKLAKAGYKTALIERRWVGGTCVNDGCTPTKAMIASAKMAHKLKESAALGITVSQSEIHFRSIIDRQQKMVKSFRDSSEKKLASEKNLDLIYGDAAFIGPKKLRIKMNDGKVEEVASAQIFIDTGSRPHIPDIDGLKTVPYLTSTSILNLDSLPAHLLIVGSGYVGLEFGQMFARFGSKVTLLARSPRILRKEDEDIASEITKILEEENIDIRLNSSAIKFNKTEKGIEVVITQNEKQQTISCSHVLIATGRTPNSDSLDLSAAGITMNEKGFIHVNNRLETNVRGIYALGEVNGEPAFTHISYNDYLILFNNVVNGKSRTTDHRLGPYCMFIDPQLGRVGMTEQEARAKNYSIKVAKLPMKSVARAIETSETKGFMKAIVDSESKRILGAAILGAEGGEIMSVVQMAMMGDVTYEKIRDGIFAHPTYAESLNNLFAGI